MKASNDGLRLWQPAARPAPWRPLLALALFGAFYAAARDVLAAPLCWLALLTGAAVTVVAALFATTRRRVLFMLALAAIGGLIAALSLDALREGATLLCARLFAASESVNRYRYPALAAHWTDPVAQWGEQLLAALLGGGVALLCGAAARDGSRAWPLLLAALAASVEIYFGVVPAGWLNALLFGFIGLALAAKGARPVHLIALAAGLIAVCAAVALLLPGVHQPLEDASERVRDRLAEALEGGEWLEAPAPDMANPVRMEGLLNEEPAQPDPEAAQGYQGYQKLIRYQENISNPEALDFLKIAALLVLAAAVVVGPFLPFYLWDARRRKALAAREVFRGEDVAAAVRAMFRHMARCLTAFGLTRRGEGFAAFLPAMAGLDPALERRFAEALPLWHRAAYSDLPVTEAERAQTEALLHDVEARVCAASGRLGRVRLKYVDFLVMTGDKP